MGEFERDYFEDPDSQKWGNYESLVQRNLWKLKRLKSIIVLYATPHHKTLLDIGCALGHFLDMLRTNFEVAGMDVSNYAIKKAQTRVKVPFAVGNIEERIPFDKKFDIITAIDIVEHLHDPKLALTNIYNHLTPGGLLFFEVPTITNWMSAMFNKLFFARDKTHIFVKKLDEIDRLLTDCHFKRITYYSTLLPFFFRTTLIVQSLSNVLGVFQKPVH